MMYLKIHQKINNKNYIFAVYDEMYYISAYGEIYSSYSKKFLKHSISVDGHHRVDIHGKHKFVHKLVYQTWVRDIKDGEQINHKNDNKNDNHYTNLYAGTQKQNIHDCIRNGHKSLNIINLKILNKETGKIEEYYMAKDFLKKCGHNQLNGSLSRAMKRNWFKQKYKIIYLKRERTRKV